MEQGPSKNTNLMEWDKIWALNKDVIDPIVPRYTAIFNKAKLVITNGPEEVEAKTQKLHPKNDSVGTKAVSYYREIWIENDDAAAIEEGEKVTLMKWGNLVVQKKEKTEEGGYVLHGELNLDDQNFSKTKKLTWIANRKDLTMDV